MKTLQLMLFLSLFSLSAMAQNKTFHDFTVKTIDGKEISLSEFKGKKVLVVNTASKCGLTPQYEQLETLYRRYADKNFVIVGFPANNFMNQEPGSDKEIAEFCSSTYDVTFPMMSKISVKGDDMAPLYKWLTSESENGVMDSKVSWNFQKYLIDENGNFVKYFSPKTDPMDNEIVAWIQGN